MFSFNVIWILITLFHFLNKLDLNVFNWCLIWKIGLDLFIGQHSNFNTFNLRLFWLGFIFKIFNNFILVVIQWVINASYWQSVACARLIVCGSDWIANNLKLRILNHFFGSFMIFRACFLQDTPNIFLSSSSSFPEFFPPFLKTFFGQWSVVCGSEHDAFTNNFGWDNFLNNLIWQELNSCSGNTTNPSIIGS